MDYSAWVGRSDAELAAADLAEMNLLAAEGLPGSEGLDIAECLERLDDWTEIVRHGAKRAMRQRMAHRDLTDAQFQVLSMVTVLQRDLGVHYNPACMTGDYDATDSRNHFIHGPLLGHGGTCISLPVLYVAIGRRLGFPLWRVAAKEHFFVRWEQGLGESFNIEATARGFAPYDDARYRDYPLPLSPAELASGEFLKSFTTRQDLAACIAQRALCCQDHLELSAGLTAIQHATQLDRRYRGDWMIMTIMTQIVAALRLLPDQSLPAAEGVRRCIPPVTESWQRWAIPIAQQELLRIHRLRLARRRMSPNENLTSTN
jgi:hypothetical protein